MTPDVAKALDEARSLVAHIRTIISAVETIAPEPRTITLPTATLSALLTVIDRLVDTVAEAGGLPLFDVKGLALLRDAKPVKRKDRP